jgi:type I restriction enzyme S subunit
MRFRTVTFGDYFRLEKGLTYRGEFLVEDSPVALVGMDSFIPGGGYKRGSEKPYSGPFKEKHTAMPGDVLFCMTDITQDGGVLAATLKVPPDSAGFKQLIFSHHVAKLVMKKDGLLPEYVYNVFRVPSIRHRAAYGDTGTTVRALPFEVLLEQQIPYPEIEEQIRICEVISAIDERIEPSQARRFASLRAGLLPTLVQGVD